MAKSVKVSSHKRSVPSTPSWKGTGNKPGPKNVTVDSHDRKSPDKK